MPFLKRFILWLLLSLPVSTLVGAAFSAYLGEGSELDRFTSGANGAIAGAWAGFAGALAAAGTVTLYRDKLKGAGGSPFLTGLIVSYGLIIASLVLLRIAA